MLCINTSETIMYLDRVHQNVLSTMFASRPRKWHLHWKITETHKANQATKYQCFKLQRSDTTHLHYCTSEGFWLLPFIHTDFICASSSNSNFKRSHYTSWEIISYALRHTYAFSLSFLPRSKKLDGILFVCQQLAFHLLLKSTVDFHPSHLYLALILSSHCLRLSQGKSIIPTLCDLSPKASHCVFMSFACACSY